MTEKEFIKALEPLEPVMETFINTGAGSLSASDVEILKNLYPTLKEWAPNGGLPNTFKTSCSSCVREVFTVFISVYYRLKQ